MKAAKIVRVTTAYMADGYEVEVTKTERTSTAIAIIPTPSMGGCISKRFTLVNGEWMEREQNQDEATTTVITFLNEHCRKEETVNE